MAGKSKRKNERELKPKLRFPEFRDAPGWEEKRLGDLGELVSGLTYSPEDVRDSGLLVLRSSNIQDGTIALDDCVYVTPTIANANLTQPNDILICVRNGSKSLIGKNALVPQGMPRCTHGAFMTVFRSPTPDFVVQLFQTAAYQKQVDGDLGATINSINGSQLKRYRFNVPSPAEQTKIAGCLSSLDELIGAESRKLEALQAHKKGLMQQLFPREGETLPRLRFPEFTDEPEWEETTVDKLANYQNGKAYEKHITGQGKYVVVNSRFISTDGVVRKYSNEEFCIASNGDVLMVLSDLPNGRAIAKCFLVDADNAYAVNQRVCRLSPFNVHSGFLGYALNRHRNLLIHDDGMTQTHLKKEHVEKCLIRVPPTQDEQRSIAECLSSAELLIERQAERVDFLKTHKKGLTQQLFPQMEDANA